MGMSFIVAGGALPLALLACVLLLDDSERQPKTRRDVPFDGW
jgi:hypothetical protein